jgi:hypothetical protein
LCDEYGDYDCDDSHEDIYGESDNYEVAESEDFNEGYDAGFNDAKKALGASVPKTAQKVLTAAQAYKEGYDAGYNAAKKDLGMSVPKTAKKSLKRDKFGRFSK